MNTYWNKGEAGEDQKGEIKGENVRKYKPRRIKHRILVKRRTEGKEGRRAPEIIIKDKIKNVRKQTRRKESKIKGKVSKGRETY